MLKYAGSDVSHWFDPKTRDLKTQIHPFSGVPVIYTPVGQFLHVPPNEPRSDWSAPEIPWWRDETKCVGNLTKKPRKVKILNLLTQDEHILEVCSEESISAIQIRYLAINSHAKGYVWKRLGNLLDTSLTLEENGIKDESLEFQKGLLNEEDYLPVIHLYFSDDLTIA